VVVDASEVLENYYNYCHYPTLARAESLWESITDSPGDFFKILDEIYFVRQTAPPYISKDSLLLYSSGSTGNVRKYGLGPFGTFWLESVEKKIKNPDNRCHVWVQRTVGFHRYKPVVSDGDWIYDHRVFGNSLDAGELIGALDKLPHPLIVNSTPSFFLALLKDDDFCRWARSRDCRFSSTVTSSFYPSRLAVNDNMIDWSSGYNFYHCSHNKRHFLPLFAGTSEVFNILNLCGESSAPSDLLTMVGEQGLCDCGDWIVPTTFVPHVVTTIQTRDGFLSLKPLADLLEERYESFQVVQRRDDLVDILYIKLDYTSMKHDKDIVEDFLRKNGLVLGLYCKNTFFRSSLSTDKTEAVVRNIHNRSYLAAMIPKILL
jgi:hypothetical protein